MDMARFVYTEETIGVLYDETEAIEVWHAYILGNEKWLFAISDEGLLSKDYFEVTYNKAKDEFYIDRYTKQSNCCLPNTN